MTCNIRMPAFSFMELPLNPQDTATHCTSAALAKNGDKLDAKFTAIRKNSFGAMRLTVLVLRRSACAPLLLANVRPYLVDMIIGRRHFIQSAIAGASLLAAPSTAADMVFVPGTGNNNAGSVPPLLLSRAKAALDMHKGRIRNHDLIAIADFSKPSRDPRFYVVDLRNGSSAHYLVAHGKGSDLSHSGWVQNFSNVHGSEATSAGSYLVSDTYIGQYGESRRLIGLDPQNDQAEARAIVIHPAWYVNQSLIHDQGKIGRSQGCFAFAQNDINVILERVAPGCLLYADKV